ncbi:hypothetical protein FRB94_000179 [Tulasnella sp. JGI-2019a]|nr:hypothetical protein FRB94_000179 [Tulasnella sp. JGI-2019a]
MTQRTYSILRYSSSTSTSKPLTTPPVRHCIAPTLSTTNHVVSSSDALPPTSPDITFWWKALNIRIEAHQKTRRQLVLPRDLVLMLICLIDSYPRQTYIQIVQQHDQYPQLHSNDSYNILLELACHSPYPNNFLLTWEAMQKNGFGDLTSHRLYIRHLVRHGNLSDAVALVDTAEGASIRQELLWEIIQVPVKRPRRYLALQGKAHKLPAPTVPDQISLQALKSALSASLNGVSSVFAESIITYLLYLHRFEDAFTITRHILRLLPKDPMHGTPSLVLSLIHKLLELPPATISKKPDPRAPPAREVLKLLAIYPGLRPNATTLAYALEWHRWELHRSQKSYWMLRKWKAKWGDHVEDSRVRHKIARFALEDRNVVLARKMINREYSARRSRFEPGQATERVAKDWEWSRNDDLWRDVIQKYAKLNPKRKWKAEEGIWLTEHKPSANSSI